MIFLVIGTFIRDEIINISGESVQSLGGLCHTISPLMAFATKEDVIIPVCNAGSDLREEIEEFLKLSPNICPDGIRYLNRPNNKVCLHYTSQSERIEKSLYPLPPLEYDAVEPFLNVDVLIMNMISGWDITLKDFKKIRAKFKNKIFLDFHSLALGRKNDGSRYYKTCDDQRDWLNQSDYIQMNENEFLTAGGKLDTPEKFIRDYINKNDVILTITLGKKGSLTIIRNDQYFQTLWIDAAHNINVIDPTGCGDVFIGAFALKYMYTFNIESAAQYANRIAALAGSAKGLARPLYLHKNI